MTPSQIRGWIYVFQAVMPTVTTFLADQVKMVMDGKPLITHPVVYVLLICNALYQASVALRAHLDGSAERQKIEKAEAASAASPATVVPLILLLSFGFALSASGQVSGKFGAGINRGINFPVRYTNSVVSAIDTFDRADSDPMSLGMSDGIGTWFSGDGVLDDMKIASSGALYNNAVQSGAMVVSPIFQANQIAKITLGTTFAGSGVRVRIKSSSDASCYFLYVVSSTTINLYKTQNFSISLMTGGNITGLSLVSGDVVSISATGTGLVSVTAYVNGVSVGSSADATTPHNSGQPGIYSALSSGIIDRFEASDL